MVQLNVRGEAEVSVVADYATIGVKVATIGDSAQGATQLAQPIVDQLRDSLVGAPDVRSVSLGGIAIAKAKHWDSHREEYVEVGWQAVLRGSFEVETVHVRAVIGRIVAAGAEVTSTWWSLNSDNDAYREVRKAAVGVATQAAQDFADALNQPLGAILSLSDPGLSQSNGSGEGAAIDAMLMSAPAGGGEDDSTLFVEPPLITISAEVEATFATKESN